MKTKTFSKILVIVLIILQIFIGQAYAANEKEEDKKEESSKSQEKEETKDKENNENDNKESTFIFESDENSVNVRAKIIEAGDIYEKEENGINGKYQDLTLRILDGNRKEEKVETTKKIEYDSINKKDERKLNEGDIVYIRYIEKDGEISNIQVGDYVRQYYLLGLLAIFLVSIIAICRKKAIKPIICLAIIFLAIYLIYGLNVSKGYNAILFSLITAIVITALIFFINIGLNKMALSGMIGTGSGIVIATGLMLLVWYFARLDGDLTMYFMSLFKMDEGINMMSLYVSGTLIAALGGCISLSLKIVNNLGRIKIENPTMGLKDLFKNGMEIGREEIGNILYTLLFVYLGTLLTSIVFSMKSSSSFIDLINSGIVSPVIMSLISCFIGIVFVIPISSIVFAFFYKDKAIYKVKSDNIVEGKRTLKI